MDQLPLAYIEQPFAIGHRQVTADMVLEPYVFTMLGLDRKEVVARSLQCSPWILLMNVHGTCFHTCLRFLFKMPAIGKSPTKRNPLVRLMALTGQA
jgi:hypothetical protein